LKESKVELNEIDDYYRKFKGMGPNINHR